MYFIPNNCCLPILIKQEIHIGSQSGFILVLELPVSATGGDACALIKVKVIYVLFSSYVRAKCPLCSLVSKMTSVTDFF